VVISFIILKVRYMIAQYAGIVGCLDGMGVLLASNQLQATTEDMRRNNCVETFGLWEVRLSTGFSNVLEVFLVSKKPLYEVVGQLAFWVF